MEDSAYQSERATVMANAVVNEIAAQSARMEARASRNADVLRNMAASDGLELGAIYDMVEAVFSTVPASNVSAGLTRKLEAMGKSKAALARACAPITKPTINSWLSRERLGVTELSICILGLCRLSGNDSVASCAGSVAALCSRDTLEGGEDALRNALIERIMAFTEYRLRAADTQALNAIAALMCTEQAERLWRQVKTDE